MDEDGKQIRIKTISSLMPLIINDLPRDFVDSLVVHLTNNNEFWPGFPVPSVCMSEKSFNPEGSFVLGRGPTWTNTNWFLSKALIHWGYNKEAGVIIDKTTEMIGKGGFREYYNPLTGEGHGQRNFTWPALVLDMYEDKNI